MSASEPYAPTREERQRGLVEVFFEIDQLERRCQLRTKVPDQTRALRESSVLHARALLSFFERNERHAPGGGRADEMLCSDYLGRLASSRSARLKAGRGWPVGLLAAPILGRSRRFIDHLIDRVLPELAPEALPAWRKLRQKVVARLSSLRSAAGG